MQMMKKSMLTGGVLLALGLSVCAAELPSVSVAHASAKAWKLGFNLHAKSSGLAKVEFSAILQQEDPRNINQHPRC